MPDPGRRSQGAAGIGRYQRGVVLCPWAAQNLSIQTISVRMPRTPADSYPAQVDLEFSGEIWFWRGPAPWHFVTVPEAQSAELEATSAFVSYGWGMIPVTAQIGTTRWETSLFPKDGLYIVPLKARVRRDEELDVGDTVAVRLAVRGPGGASWGGIPPHG